METIYRGISMNLGISMKQTGIVIILSSVIITIIYNFQYVPVLEHQRPAEVFTNPKPVLPFSPLSNAIFNKNCYEYKNVKAYNLCCSLYDYRQNTNDMKECVKRKNLQTQARKVRPTDKIPTLQPSSNKFYNESLQHWLFLGDSHARYVYVSTVFAFDKSELIYKFSNMTEWDNFADYTRNLKTESIHMDLSIQLKDAPFRVTFHWDAFLTRLPKLIKKWIHEKPKEMPTLLFLDGGHHHLGSFSVEKYEKDLTALAPELAALSKHIPVLFKLMDHLRVKQKRVNIKTEDAVNAVTKKVLATAGKVIVWDSILPLTDIYVEWCSRVDYPPEDKDRIWWCSNARHSGYIIQHQCMNMMMNFVCNAVMLPNMQFCV